MAVFACRKLWTSPRFRGISCANAGCAVCFRFMPHHDATTGASIDTGEIAQTRDSPLARCCDSRMLAATPSKNAKQIRFIRSGGTGFRCQAWPTLFLHACGCLAAMAPTTEHQNQTAFNLMPDGSIGLFSRQSAALKEIPRLGINTALSEIPLQRLMPAAAFLASKACVAFHARFDNEALDALVIKLTGVNSL